MGTCDAEIPTQPIISTTHGQVRGQLREAVYGDKYYCFDGIPYAKPPLGELRFKSPKPVEPWKDVRDCTVVAPKCIQYNRYTNRVEGSEDCLFLNIYAKKLKSEKPLPVMVYIHGGRFATGSASRLAWGPDYLLMKDVILITIGYRLGALGFLSLPEPELEVPGNAALKDILMALKWLKPNYTAFNGDANNITLFGHSSGACCVHILMMAPKCEGLFHKVILMSGLAMHISDLPDIHHRFAKHVGYQGPKDNLQILNYLRSLEPEKLCDLKFLSQTEKVLDIFYTLNPVIENSSISDAILTKNFFEMFNEKEAWSNNIPLMLSTTSFELLARYDIYKNPHMYVLFAKHPEYLLSSEVLKRCDLETSQQLVQKIIKLHLGEKEVSLENFMDVMRLASHRFIYHPLHCYLGARLKYAHAPTYLYRFDFDSADFNLYRIKLCGRQVRGVAHVDDLSYIFYIPESFKLPLDSDEFKTIVTMVDLLTAFAARSDPNVDRIKPAIWEPLRLHGVRKCLNISKEISFMEWPELEKCKAWDQFFKEAGLRLN